GRLGRLKNMRRHCIHVKLFPYPGSGCDKPDIIITPTPDTPQAKFTPSPGDSRCPPGYLWVDAGNSLNVPAGCYPNTLDERRFSYCRPLTPPGRNPVTGAQYPG